MAGIEPIVVIIRDDASDESIGIAETFLSRGAEVFACGSKDMGLMSDTAAPSDILLTAPMFPEAPVGPRIVVLDGVADPGNVGTIIRTAAWFGCTDVVLSADSADVYNPKVVRSSAGAIARINIRRRRDVTAELNAVGARPLIATVARGGAAPQDLGRMTEYGLIIGSEARGIRPEVLALANTAVTIPGGNGVESLNAAVAAAVVLYAVNV